VGLSDNDLVNNDSPYLNRLKDERSIPTLNNGITNINKRSIHTFNNGITNTNKRPILNSNCGISTINKIPSNKRNIHEHTQAMIDLAGNMNIILEPYKDVVAKSIPLGNE